MPSRTRRNRWQDLHKSDVRLDSVVQLYPMYHDDKNHSPALCWHSDLIRRFVE